MAKLKDLKKPNIVLIISDQQTWKQNWETVWAKNNLPAMNELLENGLAFNNAFTNSCTCTSSRTTLFTGTYPSSHGATQVLAFDDPYNEANPPKGYTQVMQGQLRNNMDNMFKMMEGAGYNTAYKGKWHISKPTQFIKQKSIGPLKPDIDHLYWTSKDVSHLDTMYGIKEWNYPDAGDDANIFNFGGGRFNNDGRFVDGDGQSALYGRKLPGMSLDESNEERLKACTEEYIKNYENDKPLFLVVSLVNPHDVLSYPGNETMTSPDGTPRNPPLYELGGYKDSDFEGINVKLPTTWNEKLDTKPKIQTTWQTLLQGFGEIKTEEVATNYVKFYAYLTSLVDTEIAKVLKALKANPKTKDALIIRVSDHGDMAMSHGMMRQKMFNAYQQTINIPMIFSHLSDPDMFSGKTTESFAGLIDLMPTIAEIAGIQTDTYKFQGKSLVPILEDPNETVQDHVHFTFDDSYIESDAPQDMGACRIRCIIKTIGSETWKYSVYFDPNYGQEMEYEMYNLTKDKEERYNLAFTNKNNSEFIWDKRQELHTLLTKVMKEKGTMPDTVIWPKVSGGIS